MGSLEESTQIHVDGVAERCRDLERARNDLERELTEQANRLQTECAEKAARYRHEETELKAKLEGLHSEYSEQWTAAELDVRQRLSEKTRNADEAHDALRQQIAELDAERNNELTARREQADHQQELLSEQRARV